MPLLIYFSLTNSQHSFNIVGVLYYSLQEMAHGVAGVVHVQEGVVDTLAAGREDTDSLHMELFHQVVAPLEELQGIPEGDNPWGILV